jgi:hypothetical protein
MTNNRSWCVLAAGRAAILTAFTDPASSGPQPERLLPRASTPAFAVLPGTTSPWVVAQFTDRGKPIDIGEAGRRIAAQLADRWPDLRFTVLGIETTDSDPLLHHVGISDGTPNDWHTHFDGIDVTTAVTDDTGAVGAVLTIDPTTRSFTIEPGNASPFRQVIDQMLAHSFRRSARGTALLTQIGGGFRLAEANIDDSRLRRWGVDSIYPVFELLPGAKIDELLRTPEILDDWNSREFWTTSMLPFYERSIVPELAARSTGPAALTALTVALQLVHQATFDDARQAASDIVAAGGHPRAAVLLLDELNRSNSASEMGVRRFRDLAIAVLGGAATTR